jgi:hypothetical protein
MGNQSGLETEDAPQPEVIGQPAGKRNGAALKDFLQLG